MCPCLFNYTMADDLGKVQCKDLKIQEKTMDKIMEKRKTR